VQIVVKGGAFRELI